MSLSCAPGIVHRAVKAFAGPGKVGHKAVHLALWLSLLVATARVAGCRSPGRQPSDRAAAVDTVAILSAIDTLAATVGRADATHDAALFATTWAKDGVMSLPGSPPVFGRDSIVNAFRHTPALPPGGAMRIYPLEIRVLSDEWAYAFGMDTLSYTPAGARQPTKETSTFLVLIRKTPDGWKTYREVLSANQPVKADH